MTNKKELLISLAWAVIIGGILWAAWLRDNYIHATKTELPHYRGELSNAPTQKPTNSEPDEVGKIMIAEKQMVELAYRRGCCEGIELANLWAEQRPNTSCPTNLDRASWQAFTNLTPEVWKLP